MKLLSEPETERRASIHIDVSVGSEEWYRCGLVCLSMLITAVNGREGSL
jgi:hypothetical protein